MDDDAALILHWPRRLSRASLRFAGVLVAVERAADQTVGSDAPSR